MNKRLLIVDDNRDNLYLLESLLKGHGLEVTSAENGREALEKVRLNLPDLLLTDILMPVMDGWALCREWKSDDALKHIPLVFYTATYTGSQDEKFALSLGADRFIIKPQEPDILMNILKEVLEEKDSARKALSGPLGQEMDFFRQYNEILFTKLEKKMSDLETTVQKLKKLEESYRLSFENTTDIIFTMDADLKILSMTPSVEKVLGYKPEDIIGRSLPELGYLFTPESFPQAAADLNLILKGEKIPAATYRFIDKDGTIKYGEVSGSPNIRDGKIVGSISVARDITERKQLEEILLQSEERYRTIIEEIEEGYYEVDLAGNFTFVNNAMVRQFRYSREELIGKNYRTFIPQEETEGVYKTFNKTFLTGEEVKWFPITNILKDGTLVYLENSVSSLRDKEGRIIGFRGVTRDVTERKRAEETLRSLSLKDDLTGLLNRRGFFNMAEQCLKTAQRMGTEVVLIFGDLDNFKGINDSLGHVVGDQALIDTSQILKESFRESDIVARIGGDEFVILAVDSLESSAENMIKRFDQLLKNHLIISKRPYTLSLSFGLACFDPHDPCSIDDLLVRADRKMYENKQRGFDEKTSKF